MKQTTPKTPATALRKQLAAAFLIGAVTFALVAGTRLAGGLERIELVIHDRVLNARAGLPAQTRSVVIYETEADLQRFGHPLTDERMADFLSRLDAMQPALVAIDKYRDLPIPPGTEKLAKALTDQTNVFWVAKYGTAAFDGVRPPKVLEGTARTAAEPASAGDGALGVSALREGEPSLELLLAQAQARSIDPARYQAYADRRWGSGWKLNPHGRRRAWDELVERYRNDPQGYRDKIDSELAQSEGSDS